MAYVDPNVDAEVVNPAVTATPQTTTEAAKTPSFSDWLGSPEAMALAAGFLKAGGPSPYPVSMGQAFGMGMEDMLKAKLQFGNQNLDKEKFAFHKFSDTRDYNLRKEDHDVTRDFHRAQINKLLLDQKRLDNLNKMIMGDTTNQTNSFVSSIQPNSTANSDQSNLQADIKPEVQAIPNAPTPGLLNSQPQQAPRLGILNKPQAPQQQPIQPAGGIFSNLSPEKRTMALIYLNSGHADKIPELILGKPEEAYSLSEGQIRYDKNNKPVAYGNAKDIATPLEKQVKAEGLQPGTLEYQSRMAELNSGKELYTPIIKETIAEGFKPGTPEFAARVKDRANRANIQQQIKIPPGYTPVNGGDLSAGLMRIPGGPAEEVGSQDAGRIQMIRTAKKDIGESRGNVESLLFNKKPDGSIDYTSPNRTNIFTANATGIPGMDSIPFSVGRDLRSAMEQGIQAITRIETGAAMPQSEIENTMTRYMPRSGDSDRTILLKWNRFKDFIGDANKLMDPSQRFETKRFKSDISNDKSLAEQMGKAPQGKPKTTTGASSLTDNQLKQMLGIG